MMRQELVDRRAWLDDAEFLDLVGASNAIPGPTSTEVALYTGRRRAGVAGLLVAGLAFIAPAAVVMGVLAWVYARYGTTPAFEDLFDGIQPAVVAVVALAVVRLGRAAVKTPVLGAIATVVLVLYLAGIDEPALLLAAAAVAAVVSRRPPPVGLVAVALGVPLTMPGAGRLAAGAAEAAGADLARIFAVFLKVGALLFGSGYVLFAFLQADLVETRGWLTEQELLDAIAVGQFTPGPLFTTATFIGYLLRGTPGAVVATVAIFLPCFVLVAVLEPVVARLRARPLTAAALDGLNAAAIALMAGVTWELGREAIVDVPSGLIAVTAAIVLLRVGGRLASAWVIAGGALCGLALGA